MITKFSQDHEWITIEGDVGTVGITDFAQQSLGDVVFVELPEISQHLDKGGDAAVVESVKAASEVYAIVSGEVTEVNDAIVDEPATVNSAAETDGWFFRIKLSNASELNDLMDSDAYKAFCDAQ